MIGKKDITFKEDKLYHKGENTGFSVVRDPDTYLMVRVRWPDGVLSKDYYNMTRAKDHAAALYLETQNKAPSSPAGAFK